MQDFCPHTPKHESQMSVIMSMLVKKISAGTERVLSHSKQPVDFNRAPPKQNPAYIGHGKSMFVNRHRD